MIIDYDLAYLRILRMPGSENLFELLQRGAAAMYCKSCGAWCDDDAAFCSVCGSRLQEDVSASGIRKQADDLYEDDPERSSGSSPYQKRQSGLEYDMPDDAYEAADEAEEPDEEAPGDRKKTIAVIALSAVLVVLLAAIIIVVLGKSVGKAVEDLPAATAEVEKTAEITTFAADSCNATAVSLTIEGSGYQPSGWRIVLTPESGAAITRETTERSVIIDGLTPQTDYTAVLKTTDDTALTGVTECRFTTADYTVLTTFQTESVYTDQAVLSWSWTGTDPVSWTVAWTGSDGSTGTLETADATCILTGLTADVAYDVVLSCESLQSTELSTITVTPERIAVGGWNITELSSTSVSVSWTYSGTDAVPEAWTLCYSYGSDAASVVVDCSSNNGVIVNDLLPDTTYFFTVLMADGAEVSSEQTVYTTSDGGTFEEYGCYGVSMTLYAVSSESDALNQPTTVLSESQLLGYAIEANYAYTDADKTVSTLYIIRKSSGEPLSSYSSTRSWSGAWETARHTGTFPDHMEPGEYTLEAYFNGSFLVSSTFTVE